MKQFLKKTLAFGIALLLVAAVVQALITVRIKNKTTTGHDHLTIYPGEKFDILFLGSSRCADHFIPGVFKQDVGLTSLNMGCIGHADIPSFLLKLNYYLLYHPAPRYVIMNFDLATINGPQDPAQNRNYLAKHYFARYAFFAEPHNEMVSQYFGFNLAERYLPMYAILKYKMLGDCITMKDGRNWMKKGYLEQGGVWNFDPVKQKDAVSRGHADTFRIRYAPIKDQMRYVKDLCAKNGSKLICVHTPLFSMVYEDKGFELPGQMCRELDIPYIDMHRNTIPDSVVYFSDMLHLNETGATRFCKALCADSTFRAALGGTARTVAP
ncbi:hypothetical protein GCM10023093_25540 [Nemorincola caseinilytica]|uniref:SGNH/GDSL hydrolase family protein n=1 Tax=Nemorincola caseinilytica TaxID=2054315 RepID=A0ABP8NMI5_9BACT